MARNRYKDALAINEGASNPMGIVNSLRDHIKTMQEGEDFHGTMQIREDPALRLIAHQLAHLFAANMDLTEYMRVVDACKKGAE